MKQIKKFICLAASIFLILAMCVPVSATASVIELDKYIVAGTSLDLSSITANGETVNWNADSVDTSVPARRVVTGTTATSNSLVELTVHVGMYEPTILDNFEDETNSTVLNGTVSVGKWYTYSGAKYGAVWAKEQTGNQFLRLTANKISETDHSMRYGATYVLNDSGVSSGTMRLEVKVKIPRSTSGTSLELRMHPSTGTSPNAAAYAGITAAVSVENGAYIYRVKDNGAVKGDYTKVLTSYAEQWLNLRWDINPATGVYDLYCDGKFVENVPVGWNSSVTTKNIKYLQVLGRESNQTEIWVDDIVYYENISSPSANVLYYGDVQPQELTLAKNSCQSAIVNVPLVTESDNVVSETTKVSGLIVKGLSDTSMTGQFEIPVMNYETANENAKVYKLYEKYEQLFGEDYTISDSSGQNIIETGMLKVAAPAANGTRAYEDLSVDIPADKDAYELEFEIKLPTPTAATQHFYIQLLNGGITCTQLYFKGTTSSGNWNLTCGSATLLINNSMANDELSKIKIVIDREKQTMAAYLNDEFVNTIGFSMINKSDYKPDNAVASLRIYNYPGDNGSAVYVDNIYLRTYEKVSLVDTNVSSATVVRRQQPDLQKYVTTTLTDNSSDKLPVKWNATNTSELGATTATGMVYGYTDSEGNAVSVTAEVNVIALPYTTSISEAVLIISAATSYLPTGTVYLAAYNGGELASVTVLGEISESGLGSVSWDSGAVTADITEEADSYRVFVFTDEMQPLAAN